MSEMLTERDLIIIEETILQNEYFGIGSLSYIDMQNLLKEMRELGYDIIKIGDNNAKD